MKRSEIILAMFFLMLIIVTVSDIVLQNQITRVKQQNDAIVESVTALAGTLESLTETLKGYVDSK